MFKAYTKEEDANDCRVVRGKMKGYCIGEVRRKRDFFRRREKLPTETLDNLMAELKGTLAKSCNLCDFFTVLHDTLICVRLVVG